MSGGTTLRLRTPRLSRMGIRSSCPASSPQTETGILPASVSTVRMRRRTAGWLSKKYSFTNGFSRPADMVNWVRSFVPMPVPVLQHGKDGAAALHRTAPGLEATVVRFSAGAISRMASWRQPLLHRARSVPASIRCGRCGYRDLMTGRVPEEGTFKGITAEAWRSGTCTRHPAGFQII